MAGPSTTPPPPSSCWPISSPGGRNRPGSVGSAGTSSGSSARTSLGVISTSSSVRSCRSALLLNRCADDRKLAEDRYRRLIGLRRVVDESGDRERLAVAQLHFRLRTAHGQCRNPEALEQDAVVEVERADLGPHPQLDQVAGNSRREVQPHAEFPELDRDGADAASRRARGIRRRQGSSPPGRCRPADSVRPGSGSSPSAAGPGSRCPC